MVVVQIVADDSIVGFILSRLARQTFLDRACGKNIRTDMSLSLLAVIHALTVAVPVVTARK